MNRRAFVAGLGAVLAAPLGAEAQQAGKVWRIGVLWPTGSKTTGWAAFVQGLQELGYVEGQNLVIEDRLFEDRVRGERLPAAAAELVRLNPDLIFAPGSEVVLKAAHQSTTTIPIVMLAVDFDPIAHGYVASLRRPGNNITGLVLLQLELAAKRMELLRDALPRARRAAVPSPRTN
jgi:putative tryptophan/tyrosine transport system substrate-binding protein